MTHDEFSKLVSTFAYHCTCMMTDPAPHKGKMGLGFGDTVKVVTFEIEPCRWNGGSEPDPETGKHPVNVWDQVTFIESDGSRRPVGNRGGGYQQYAAEMADLLLEAAQSVS